MRHIFLIFLSFLIFSCSHNETERAIYFWKSDFKLSDAEKEFVSNHDIKKIYIKYFDVDIDADYAKPIPLASLAFNEKPTKAYRIIPTVFITNRSLQKLNKKDVEELANKICQRIIDMNTHFELEDIIEIQIDCDWTASTQKKYFLLLQEIRKNNYFEDKILSATIRLHQIKYMDESGIPPVDRGLLMCYNISNIKDFNVRNSIFDINEAGKYTDELSNYKIPLDIALPIYSWGVVFDAQKFKMIINNINLEELENTANFEQINNNYYKALKRTKVNGFEIDKNEIIRFEKSETENIIKFAGKLKLNNNQFTVSLFHLDEKTIKNLKNNEAEQIYKAFN